MKLQNSLRSYRANLIQPGIQAEDVEAHAAAGTLRTIRLRAPSCTHAQIAAHQVTGLPVHSVERIEVAAA